MGWVFFKEKEEMKYPPDLANDKLIQWQHKYYVPIAIVVSIVIPAVIGWGLGAPLGGLFVLGFLRVVLLHHSTFSINSLCHLVGKQPFSDSNSSMDSPLIALVSNGEGYHNFHHTFQSDYRNGYRWYHWDPSKWFIGLMKICGLAKNLHRTNDIKILCARLTMEEKKIRQRTIPLKAFEITSLEKVKIRVQEAQQKWIEIKEEYKRLKKTLPKDSRDKLDEIKANLKKAREEFKLAYDQWHLQLNSLALA